MQSAQGVKVDMSQEYEQISISRKILPKRRSAPTDRRRTALPKDQKRTVENEGYMIGILIFRSVSGQDEQAWNQPISLSIVRRPSPIGETKISPERR